VKDPGTTKNADFKRYALRCNQWQEARLKPYSVLRLFTLETFAISSLRFDTTCTMAEGTRHRHEAKRKKIA